jgi:hypothetical protein
LKYNENAVRHLTVKPEEPQNSRADRDIPFAQSLLSRDTFTIRFRKCPGVQGQGNVSAALLALPFLFALYNCSEHFQELFFLLSLRVVESKFVDIYLFHGTMYAPLEHEQI